jgi:hypothetical protein
LSTGISIASASTKKQTASDWRSEKSSGREDANNFTDSEIMGDGDVSSVASNAPSVPSRYDSQIDRLDTPVSEVIIELSPDTTIVENEFGMSPEDLTAARDHSTDHSEITEGSFIFVSTASSKSSTRSSDPIPHHMVVSALKELEENEGPVEIRDSEMTYHVSIPPRKDSILRSSLWTMNDDISQSVVERKNRDEINASIILSEEQVVDTCLQFLVDGFDELFKSRQVKPSFLDVVLCADPSIHRVCKDRLHFPTLMFLTTVPIINLYV